MSDFDAWNNWSDGERMLQWIGQKERADKLAQELRERAEAEAAAGRAAEAAKLTARAEAKVERAEVKAESLQQAAAMTVAPVVQAEQPKVRGVATREDLNTLGIKNP